MDELERTLEHRAILTGDRVVVVHRMVPICLRLSGVREVESNTIDVRGVVPVLIPHQYKHTKCTLSVSPKYWAVGSEIFELCGTELTSTLLASPFVRAATSPGRSAI